MAERMRKTHQEDVRKKIQTSQLVNRLTDHVLGTVEMTPTQVQAANILLKKALPDLQAVDLSALVQAAVTVSGALKWQRSQ